MTTRFTDGLEHLSQGWTLIRKPGIRQFVIIPLLINFLLLFAALYFAFGQAAIFVEYVKHHTYDWLSNYLGWFLWPIAVVILLLAFCYLFAILANWIAAPFNGLLSEAVECELTGTKNEASLMDAVKDVPRVLGRELSKLLYYLPRALVFLAAFFFLPVIGQVLWFLFSAWMLSIQYIDYPMDNHKIPFKQATKAMKKHRMQSFGFGTLVLIITMIPIVNLFIMPVAVAGGTALWVKTYRDDYRNY